MITYSASAYIMAGRLNQKPTIIWASNPHLFSGLTGHLLAKKFKAHFLFEVRDLWPQVFVDIGAFSPRHPVILSLRIIERFIYRHAELIITLMDKASDYLEEYGVERGKISYLPHGIDVEMFQSSKSELPPEIFDGIGREKEKGKLIVGYLGAHGIADALETIVDCCARLQTMGRRDIHFVLIGHGSEKLRIEQKARGMKLENISFFQAVPKNSVPAVIKLFDMAIVSKKDSPLYKYGTSFIKTFDYMACGVPILWAVNAPDCPVREAECGLAVPAEQPKEMAEAVVSLADMDDEIRKAIGQRGLNYVMIRHDNRVLGQRLKQLFQGICTKPYS